jgi:hypothetical protein
MNHEVFRLYKADISLFHLLLKNGFIFSKIIKLINIAGIKRGNNKYY